MTPGGTWTWGVNVGTGTGVLAGAASGAPTGYVPVGAADAAGAGKLDVNGVTTGGGAVVLRFRVAIPGSRPVVCTGIGTKGTEVDGTDPPTKGTSENPSGAGDVLGLGGSSSDSLMGIL